MAVTYILPAILGLLTTLLSTCRIPEMAVAASTCTTVSVPSVSSESCCPNANAGRADAKKIYRAGAKILQLSGT